MLENITTIGLVSVGVMLGLFIVAYAVYITFYPLFRTIGGGLQVLKSYGEQRVRALEEAYALIPDAQLGFTMADGGDRVEEKESPESEE